MKGKIHEECEDCLDRMTVLRSMIRQLDHEFDLQAKRYHKLDKKRRCQKIEGCKGFKNHMGCHNV